MSKSTFNVTRPAPRATVIPPYVGVCVDQADLYGREQALRRIAINFNLCGDVRTGASCAAVELQQARHRHEAHCSICLKAEQMIGRAA